MADIKKIAEIEIDSKKAIDNLRSLSTEIEKLNKVKQAYDKDVKAGRELSADEQNDYEKTIAVLKDMQRQQRELRKTLENQVRQQTMAKDSLKGMRAELSNLNQQYDELTQTQRNSKMGQDLANQIKTLSQTIKSAEEDTDRYYRNVGNYANSIQKAFANTEWGKWFNVIRSGFDSVDEAAKKTTDSVVDNTGKMKGGIDGLGAGATTTTKGIGGAFKTMGAMCKQAIGGVMKAMTALLANPYALAIAAIIAVIALVVKKIDDSEERVNSLKKAIAPLEVVVDLLKQGLSKLADGLVVVIDAFLAYETALLKAYAAVSDFLGITDDAVGKIDEYSKHAEEEIAIEEERRQQKIDNAKLDLDIAKANDKYAQSSKKDYATRKANLEEVIRLEEQKAKKDKELADREYKWAVDEAARDDNDKEANDKLAEAEAKRYAAEKAYYDNTKKAQKQLAALRDEEIEKEKKLADEAAKRAKEAADRAKTQYSKQISEQRKAQDLLIALIKDENDKARAEENANYTRQIEDLKQRLKTEKDLNIQARQAINKQIILLQQQHNANLDKIAKEESAKQLERTKNDYDLELEGIEAGSERALQLKIEKLRTEKEIELSNTELTEHEKYLIRQKYAKQEADLITESTKAKQEKAEQAAETQAQIELAKLKVTGASELEQLKLQADQAANAFASMTQKEGETDDEFQLRLLNNQQKAIDTEKAYNDKRKEIQAKTAEGYENIANSLAQVATETAAGTKAEKAMKKVSAALGVVTSGVALAKSVSSAASAPWPANIAAIAGAIAQMVPIIANIKTLTGYSTGGTITNGSTGTADDVPIAVSKGEAVMNARAVRMFSPLLSQMNQSTGGAPIISVGSASNVNDNNFIAQQFASAVSAMPQPVVSVTDFLSAQNRLNTVRIESRL